MLWIEHNAAAALSTRNSTGVIAGWWGANAVNQTQAPPASYRVKKPAGSIDECNDPWVLDYFPWVCVGQHGCHKSGRGGHRAGAGAGLRRRRPMMASVFDSRKTKVKPLADSDGLVRTVETEGSGLGVVKAASDLTLKGRRCERLKR